MRTNRFFVFLCLAMMGLGMSSCVTSKSVRYLTDMPKEGLPLTQTLEATICPYDELRIFVMSSGSDQEELLKPFNVMGTMSQNNNNNVNRMGYLVDANGDIQFPVLGNLHVSGQTRLQLQDSIAARLKREGHLNDPLVMVRFMNFRVFFLTGDGGKVITVNNERCTFLEALAMAGGLDLYTRRDRIGVMREVNGKRVIHYLDPRSTSVFEDEFFLLQQNDIIFTEVSTHRFLKEGYANWSLLVSALSSIATLVGIYNLLKKNNGSGG